MYNYNKDLKMDKNKHYQPVTAVWEVTMGCNMRCKHCGSSCSHPLPDELNTEEALACIDQLADIHLRWITISGGEPLTRKDLPLLIRRLKEKGIVVNIITNGWLLKERAEVLHEAGISTVAVSIDGPRDIHDKIRMTGSYTRSEEGIRALKKLGVTVGAVTTITKQNIDRLSELRDDLIRIGVDSWQIQIGLPMGNLAQRPDWVIEPSQVDNLIDFCYETMQQGKIRIYPADCVGYYNIKELEVRRASYKTENVLWDGCNAGVRGFGILHNGDILGCTSIRSREFIEGNIRERSLAAIWNDPSCFLWRRDMKKSQLSGNCGRCVYGSKCLGGCPNTRLTMNGNIYGENIYCSYNNHLRSLELKLAERVDKEKMLTEAKEAVRNEDFQKTALLCARILKVKESNPDALKLKGYAEFMCGNYKESECDNRKVLESIPDDVYALKGLALALYKQDRSREEVVMLLDRADVLSNHADADLIHDMEIIKRDLAFR